MILVNRDNPAAGGIGVGTQEEYRTLVVQVAVAAVKAIEQLDNPTARVFQVDVKQAVPGAAALPDVNQQVLAIPGGLGPEAPPWLVGPVIDQAILFLCLAELVIKQLGQGIRPLVFLRQMLIGIAGIIEALAGMVPGGPRKLDPVDQVGQVGSAIHVAYVDPLPVRARIGDGIGEPAPVGRGVGARDRRGAVAAEAIGIEQHPGFLVQEAHGVQDRMVLQAIVDPDEIAVARFPGCPVLGVVPQLGQTGIQGLAYRDAPQVTLGQPVLAIDPSLGLRALHFLQPVIGVRNEIAMDLEHGFRAPGFGGLVVGRRAGNQEDRA